MRYFFAILLLVVARSAFAGSCDVEVTPLSRDARAYLKLVRIGMNESEISVEAIRVVMQSERPASPLTGPRGPRNLELHRKFRRVLTQLDNKEWPKILASLSSIHDEAAQQRVNVAEAQEETAPIFNWKPLGQKLTRSPGAIFTNSKGVIYFVTGNVSTTYIHRVGSDNVVTLANHEHNSRLVDFYETPSGQTLFASVGHRTLKVYNLDTDQALFSEPMPELYREYSLDNFRPLLAGDFPNLKVALVLSSQLSRDTWYPRVEAGVFDLATKEFQKVSLSTIGAVNFSRTPNGSVLAYSLAYERDAVGEFKILSQYVVGDGELLTGKFISEKELLTKDAVRPLMFTRKGKMQLALLSNSGYIFNSETQALEIMGGPSIPEGWGLSVTTQRDGRAWFAMLGSANEVGEIHMGEIIESGNSSARAVNLKEFIQLPDRGLSTRNFQFFLTPKATYAFTTEDLNLKAQAIHLVNVETGAHRRVAMPKIKGEFATSISDPIYNPKDGSYLAFISTDPPKWELYQFYGR